MAAGRSASARARCRTRRRLGSRSRPAGAARRARIAARLLRRCLVGHRRAPMDRHDDRTDSLARRGGPRGRARHSRREPLRADQLRPGGARGPRSEEHTSELQSHLNLVCRLLLEKKKKKINNHHFLKKKKNKKK